MSDTLLTKEEIKKNNEVFFTDFIGDNNDENGFNAMDEYAKQQSIAFFKWYVLKSVTFVSYLESVKPIVTSNEIEEKLKQFEGKSFDELYSQFISDQLNQPTNEYR
jgi:hypothetical protein